MIKLAEIDKLGILTKLYDTLYAPTCVKRELHFPSAAVKFLSEHVEVRDVSPLTPPPKYVSGVETCDMDVYLVYCDVDADEMLFADRRAKNRLGNLGKARDIIELKDLAEKKGVFNRQDSKNFLQALKEIKYRPHVVDAELRNYL